jgi:hypothetical protein
MEDWDLAKIFEQLEADGCGLDGRLGISPTTSLDTWVNQTGEPRTNYSSQHEDSETLYFEADDSKAGAKCKAEASSVPVLNQDLLDTFLHSISTQAGTKPSPPATALAPISHQPGDLCPDLGTSSSRNRRKSALNSRCLEEQTNTQPEFSTAIEEEENSGECKRRKRSSCPKLVVDVERPKRAKKTPPPRPRKEKYHEKNPDDYSDQETKDKIMRAKSAEQGRAKRKAEQLSKDEQLVIKDQTIVELTEIVAIQAETISTLEQLLRNTTGGPTPTPTLRHADISVSQ